MYKVAGVMLVGGAGTRLWPLVEYNTQSKATLKLAGKRLAYFNADRLEEAHVKHLVLPVQFNIGEIKWKLNFRNHSFDEVSFTEALQEYFPPDEQPRFRGTADAVLQSRKKLEGSDYLIVVPCDHVTNVDLGELLSRAIFNWEKYEAVMTTAAMEKPEEEIAGALGNPKIDSNGKVVEWKEKPEVPISDLAALGIYAGPTRELLTAIEKSGHDFGKNVLKRLREEGCLYAHFYPGEEYYWNDVGTPEMFLQAGRDLLAGGNKVKGITIPYVKVDEKITRFGGSVRNCLMPSGIDQPTIHGNVEDSIVGPYSVVDPNANVVDSILMGNNNIKIGLGETVDVRGSILGKYAYVSRTNLKRCVLGRQVKMHGCKVTDGIRIHPDAELYDETITEDVRREDNG